MLKRYINRDQNKAISMVDMEQEDTTAEENDCQSCIKNSDPVKLENFDILQNIDSKLLHLEHFQQNQLKDLNFEFRHIFPGVHSRTYIFHHVILRDNANHACRMKPGKQECLKDSIYCFNSVIWIFLLLKALLLVCK